MCGLAGCWECSSVAADALRARAEVMTDTLRHRGPDDSGVWVEPEAGLALGHRRLSIIDLSPEGHQPMISHEGAWVIVFNGEIYNFQQIRRELEACGHGFRGHSDTEVMLAAFTEWGVDASLRRFNGMFAFALWNRPRRQLWLARDRMGKKPLYYGWAGGALLFGSELKALRAHPRFDSGIDRDSLALYFRHGYVPSPYSIYRGIFKLPPATRLCLEEAAPATRPEPVSYWSAKEAAERAKRSATSEDPRESEAELRTLLSDAVGMRMISDVPLGAFLSGGIDSSLTVALMQSISHRPVKTFAIGFREAAFNEADQARAVARHLGTEHTELCVTPEEAREVVPRLPEMYDEPLADCSQIPTFLVSRLACRAVTVTLSGDGGDELFGGYEAYRSNSNGWRKYSLIPQPLRRLAGRFLALGGGHRSRVGLAMRHQDLELIYRDLFSMWEEPAGVVPGASEPPTVFSDRRRWAALGSFVEKMMYLDSVSYLPDDILVKVDRASMAVSLEARCPLLDYRVYEFAWRLPLDWKAGPGVGKLPLRRLLGEFVPKELWDRPKCGFGVPIADWMRGPLREWAEELLSASALREGGLNPAPVRRRWEEHLRGVYNWDLPLWAALMFQAWRRSAKVAL